jgi:hypothetical protein
MAVLMQQPNAPVASTYHCLKSLNRFLSGIVVVAIFFALVDSTSE